MPETCIYGKVRAGKVLGGVFGTLNVGVGIPLWATGQDPQLYY
jgi:hypothetical protein